MAAAASATEPVNAPVIGDANRPAAVAAGFTALPQPVVPSAASAAEAASAAAASEASAAGASAAPPASAGADAPRAASLPPIRRPHRPRRPASDAQPLVATPRDDNHRATASAKAADAGTAH